MRIILHSSSFYVLGAVVLIGSAILLLLGTLQGEERPQITTTIERGDIAEIVSVSGIVEAQNTADLAFPVSGIVTDVFVDEGHGVEKGEVLATLASAQLVAQRLNAVATLEKATAEKDELIAGPTEEARSVTSQTVRNAEQNLAQVIAEQNEKVENAKKTLLSSSLAAYSVNQDEEALAPTITGTYTCEEEGAYLIDIYNSEALSGYSFNLSGLEGGTFTASVDSPGGFGTCGLFAQFDTASNYSRSEWTVPIPNNRSAAYQTNLNAYNLALQQQKNAIAAAEHALELTQEEAVLKNASPRSEAIRKANATILQAQAQINAIDAQIADRSIVAPFSGTVTDVTILPGETATTEPVITLLATDAFELTARIPEIDITKIVEGQKTKVYFDARSDEEIAGAVAFVSPLAIEIDGVAYFESNITFPDVPTWIRSGLNADIDIVVAKAHDVLKIPKRFIFKDEQGNDTVFEFVGEEAQKRTIEMGFVGNDGFVEIIGLPLGTTLVAP